MFRNDFPLFKRGLILKKEMLENLRDYPRNYINILYKDYADGVICGCDMEVEDTKIVIHEGIVKNNGKIYFLEEKNKIDYQSTNRQMVIKINFFDEGTENCFKRQNGEIVIEEEKVVEKNIIELGRFKLREGAKLRSSYSDFFDFSTEYNTLNIINVPYSMEITPTISSKITNMFAEILLQKSSDINDLDLIFAMQSLTSRYVSRELICMYLYKRLRLKSAEMSNMDIYKNMCRIVKEVQHNQKINFGDKTGDRPKRIIVD